MLITVLDTINAIDWSIDWSEYSPWLAQQRSGCKHCWTTQASAQQVLVSGDSQTNGQTEPSRKAPVYAAGEK